MAGAVVTAQAEGRTVSAESTFADPDGVDEAEEWTSDQLSDAAAVASSVLAQHGAVQQVSHPYCCHLSILPAASLERACL